jgi:carbon starvation protein
MNSALLTIISLSIFYLGYKFYSKYIAEKIYGLDDSYKKTPAHEFEDGIDYVPTNKHILFGHHFTSIAGAAPIIGPCIALYWGWVPAVLWVVLGTVFMGAVHDFGALVLSLKEKGKSVADISSKVINKRIRIMFLVFIMLLTWLVLAVFAEAIASAFKNNPKAVLPVNIEIIIAIIIGYFIYKKKFDALIPSVIALAVLYLFVWIGTYNPIDLKDLGFNNDTTIKNTWILILFVYSGIASLIPVWILLQPRDYINSHQLIVGLGLIFLSIFIIQPEITIPAIDHLNDKEHSIIPFLFVTIACGAISGFHGLVSSGTTSKQVSQMKDARMIGYGATLGEGSLALAAIIAAAAGYAMHEHGFHGHTSFPDKGTAIGTFINGGAALLEQISLSKDLAKNLMVVLVVSFAATTLDSATRIQRYIITEFATATKINFLKNKYLATFISIIPAYFIATNDGIRKELWQTFGASNQMLAALTLMIISIYFWKKKKNIIPLLVPMIIIMVITIWALIIKFKTADTPLLTIINGTLILLILWMIIEGCIYCFKNYKNIKISNE